MTFESYRESQNVILDERRGKTISFFCILEAERNKCLVEAS